MVTYNNGFVGFSYGSENTQLFQFPVFQDCILSHNEMSSFGVLPTKLFNRKAVVETKYAHFGKQNVTLKACKRIMLLLLDSLDFRWVII